MVGALVASLGLAGCSAKKAAVDTTTTITSTTVLPTTTSTISQTAYLTIGVSTQLSSDGQDPSILLPSSCSLLNDTVTATGSFNGGFAPEAYQRYGDVVELYAYDAPSMQRIADNRAKFLTWDLRSRLPSQAMIPGQSQLPWTPLSSRRPNAQSPCSRHTHSWALAMQEDRSRGSQEPEGLGDRSESAPTTAV